MEPGDIAAHIPVLPLPWRDVRHQPLRDFVFASDLQSAPQYSPYVVLPLGFGAFFNHSFEPNVCFWSVASSCFFMFFSIFFFSIPLPPKRNTHCLVAPCGCKCVCFPFLLVSKQFETCLLPKLAPSNASYLSTTSIIHFHPQTLGQPKTISNNSHVSGRSGSPGYRPGLYRYDRLALPSGRGVPGGRGTGWGAAAGLRRSLLVRALARRTKRRSPRAPVELERVLRKKEGRERDFFFWKLDGLSSWWMLMVTLRYWIIDNQS